MVGLELEEVDLEVGRPLDVGEDERVDVHGVCVSPDGQDVCAGASGRRRRRGLGPGDGGVVVLVVQPGGGGGRGGRSRGGLLTVQHRGRGRAASAGEHGGGGVDGVGVGVQAPVRRRPPSAAECSVFLFTFLSHFFSRP